MADGVDKLVAVHDDFLRKMREDMRLIGDVAVLLEKANDASKVEVCAKSTAQYLKLERTLNIHKATLAEVKRSLAADADGEDQAAWYEEQIAKREKEAGPFEATLNSNPKYKEFKQKIWNVNHPNEAMSGSDEDLVEAPVERTIICPITKTQFVNPVRNKACGHVFTRDAIMDLLQRQKHGMDCPVPGCDKQIVAGGLEPDEEMEHILRRAKRLAATQADSGEGEYTTL
eukprot:TRINITY_DN3890_c0_g1_i1.p1 TRINITY_DN3890_c0_g1~~TRINITY_DN3890_c0_g1_i1.p1  ORF type:complete len:250 (+),score=74.23 TRINITY_DN3890_c0_g1_i1:65-751(+)